MPIKIFTCCLCSKPVTRRKSLSMGGERACRHHEEVINMLEVARQEKENRETDQRINDTISATLLASLVRVKRFMGDIEFDASYRMLTARGVSGSVLAKVKEIVAAKGDMSMREALESMHTYLHLFKDHHP